MAFGKKSEIVTGNIRDMVPNPETSFIWLHPVKSESKRSTNHTEDVSIRLGVAARDKITKEVKTHVYCFTFRNDVGLKLNEEYCEVAVFENRIYFRPTDDEKLGYKIRSYSCKDPSKCNGNMKIARLDSNKDILDKFIGDYALEYDKIYKLHYIEIPES